MAVQLKLNGERIQTLKFKIDKGRVVSNAECGPTPPGEIVIRSAFCNLRCIPCFAFSYSWPEKAKNNKNIMDVSIDRLLSEFIAFLKNEPIPGNKESYNWFRILGGEPFLSRETLKLYVNFLKNIPEEIVDLFNKSILIQTNGIVIGRLRKDELLKILRPLEGKSFKIVIEVSIKGSNPKEFGIITQSNPSVSHKLFKFNIDACENLEFINSHISNVIWTAVAGFGIGVTNLISGNLNRKEYIKTFYHPATNKPFYHPDHWDDSFKKLYVTHVEKYKRKFGEKFPMFGIEDRYYWKFALCGLRNCKKYGRHYFYDGFEVYKKGSAPRNEELEKSMLEIIRRFFFGDPTYYYTKLFQ